MMGCSWTVPGLPAAKAWRSLQIACGCEKARKLVANCMALCTVSRLAEVSTIMIPWWVNTWLRLRSGAHTDRQTLPLLQRPAVICIVPVLYCNTRTRTGNYRITTTYYTRL